MRMQEAESSFERMKKRYGDAVVLQDAVLSKVRKRMPKQPPRAGRREGIAGFSAGAGQAGRCITGQFASLRSRDHDTYAAILALPADQATT